MKKKEIISLIITGILIILSIGIFLNAQNTSKSAKVDCKPACFQIGDGRWRFPGVDSNIDLFSTQNECISACQVRFHQ